MSDTDTITQDSATDDAAAGSSSADDASQDTGATDGQEALGDAGKKALDAMKAERNAARKEAREAKRQLEEAIAAAAKTADKGDEPDLDAIRAEAEKTAQTKANERILRAEVRAAAAGKLADPADAVKFLDLSQFDVGADGEIDADEVADAIDDLVKAKPYLAAQGGKTRFNGNADGGTRKEERPSQFTRAEMARMTPGQIVEAEAKGQLDDVLGRS